MGTLNATITGETGPEQAVEELVLSNCRNAKFDASEMVLAIEQSDGSVRDFDLAVATTITLTKTGTTFALTVE